MDTQSPVYKNLISAIDIDRDFSSIRYLSFKELSSDLNFYDFEEDINSKNDSIELNLIKNHAYKEAAILKLKSNLDNEILGMLKIEQKTFGGSKLFYINNKKDRLLILSTPGSMESKLNMVVSRINKINDKVSRLNSKIKRENIEAFTGRKELKDMKDRILNLINKNLKV
jgi:hypothetical protein